MILLLIIIVLLVVFGGGLGYSSRSYQGPGLLWGLAILLIILWALGILRF